MDNYNIEDQLFDIFTKALVNFFYFSQGNFKLNLFLIMTVL